MKKLMLMYAQLYHKNFGAKLLSQGDTHLFVSICGPFLSYKGKNGQQQHHLEKKLTPGMVRVLCKGFHIFCLAIVHVFGTCGHPRKNVLHNIF
jgi:hypothetical protein